MAPKIPAQKILILMPNWLGDAVMATPFLRALRSLYPHACLNALARPLAAPVLAGALLLDEVRVVKKSDPVPLTLRWIRAEKFDLAVLLPNSFRSAWLPWRAGIPRRLGYARDYRSPLLTDTVVPIPRSPEQLALDRQKSAAIREIGKQLNAPAHPRVGSRYQPIPTIDYYLKLAAYLGAPADASKQMHLAVTAQEQTEADTALTLAGIPPPPSSPVENRNSKIENIITIVPGANFGSSKCWPPERFAQVADRLMDSQSPTNAHVILATSPAELPIADAILAASALCPAGKGVGRLHATATLNAGQPLSIGALKRIIQRSQLVLCNDTGPRHFAAAFRIPTVTLFGPTDPVWAETNSPCEIILRTAPPCSPCQLKTCPIDHRCMKDLSVQNVMDAVTSLLHPPPPPEPDIDPRTFTGSPPITATTKHV